MDFVSAHPYPNDWLFDPTGTTVMDYRPEGATRQDLTVTRGYMRQSAFPRAEMQMDEWSISSRDSNHDRLLMAPFLVPNLLECVGFCDRLGFWAVSDMFEEVGVWGTRHFMVDLAS